MANSSPVQFKSALNTQILMLILLITLFTSCSKSNDPKLIISDSSYVITGLSVFIGGDSSNWDVSIRNTYAFDSLKNQLTQTVAESTFGDTNAYTYNSIYQYDNFNRLQAIIFGRHQYAYKSMSFQYNTAGDIKKAVFIDMNNATIENEFSVRSQNGNIVISQYDTIASNLGKGIYYSNRPAIFQYTINPNGKLINLHSISSELYNGRPSYEDTTDSQLTYDQNNHLIRTMSRIIATDNMGSIVETDDTTQFVRDGLSASHVQELAVAVLRNINWLKTSDGVFLFKNLYSTQYGNVSREEPLKSTFDAFKNFTIAANYQNTFDSHGLLQESSMVTVAKNIFASNTTRETHYYKYAKINR